MVKKTAGLAVCLFVTFALTAMGTADMYGAHGYKMFGPNLGEMDTNQDDRVSFEEYEASHSKHLKAAFDMLDANNDGVIDNAEWDQFRKVHGMSDTM
jgi:hypothetical protein